VERAYLDTNVPSFATTTRADPAAVYRREVTLAFWRGVPGKLELFVSELVDAELAAGDWSGRDAAVDLVKGLARLPVTADARRLAASYVSAGLMPATDFRDAFHLALASVHLMDYLLSWNVRHLANPRKSDRLALINRRFGLAAPVVCTPEALLEEDSDG
jgi:hypothetical protein